MSSESVTDASPRLRARSGARPGAPAGALGRARALPVLLLLAALAACGDDAGSGSAGGTGSRSGAGRRGPTAAELAALPAGTRAMVERLTAIAEAADAADDGYLSDKAVERFRRELAEDEMSEEDRLQLRAKLGHELIVAGRSGEAIPFLEELEADVRGGGAPKVLLIRVQELLGLAWLRAGEEANCIAHHGTESCLLPIRGSGLHQDREGSEQALEVFLDILRRRPKHFESRWLANIAAMTLGKDPESLPDGVGIPLTVFDSEAELPRFPEVATSRGVDVTSLSGGVCMDDFDGDGDLDLVTSSWGLEDQMRYLENDGTGHFTDRTAEAGLAGLTGGLNMVHADYDNDGLPDVLVLRGAWRFEAGRIPNSLLRNLGGGRFEDVTEQVGLLSAHPTQTAAFGDYDGDGWLDLFIGNESQPGAPAHPCELYHNEGGTFREVASRVGADVVGYVKGVAFGDADGDGLPDLYLSRNDGPNVFLRNAGPASPTADDARFRPGAGVAGPAAGDAASGTGDGTSATPLERPAAAAFRPWRFVDATAAAGVAEPAWSFPTWFFDYDNDGHLDLWVSGYQFNSVRHVVKSVLGKKHSGVLPKLYRNRGDGTFEDATEAAGADDLLLTMGANYGDIDSDGYPDFYAATGEPDFRALYPNRMFLNVPAGSGGPTGGFVPGPGARRFADVTTAGGFGHLQKGHGIAFGDLDGDGDQDVYAVMGGAFTGDTFQNALFENPVAQVGAPSAGGAPPRWLTLRLQGVEANAGAVGARVAATVRRPDGSRRTVQHVVGTGGSFGSQSVQAELGLGDAEALEVLEVVWPGSLRRQRWEGLEPDRVHVLREGVAAPLPAGG